VLGLGENMCFTECPSVDFYFQFVINECFGFHYVWLLFFTDLIYYTFLFHDNVEFSLREKRFVTL